MDKHDRNRMNMVKGTSKWLGNNASELEHLPKFKVTRIDLKQKIKDTDEAAKDADKGGGSTEKKKALKNILVQATMEVLKPLILLATFTNDPELLNQADINVSTLNKLSMIALVARCNVVLDLIESHDAAEYAQTPEKIKAIKQALADFEAAGTNPRLTIVERKEANARLDDCVDDAVDLLNEKMDRIIDLIEFDNPRLFNEYEAIRIIVG